MIAHGQNHPGFDGALSCEEFGGAGGVAYGPAWYGLETAHHGPDAVDPGKDDGCFVRTNPDRNPGIR